MLRQPGWEDVFDQLANGPDACLQRAVLGFGQGHIPSGNAPLPVLFLALNLTSAQACAHCAGGTAERGTGLGDGQEHGYVGVRQAQLAGSQENSGDMPLDLGFRVADGDDRERAAIPLEAALPRTRLHGPAAGGRTGGSPRCCPATRARP
jgi:hypothetical protein